MSQIRRATFFLALLFLTFVFQASPLFAAGKALELLPKGAYGYVQVDYQGLLGKLPKQKLEDLEDIAKRIGVNPAKSVDTAAIALYPLDHFLMIAEGRFEPEKIDEALAKTDFMPVESFEYSTRKIFSLNKSLYVSVLSKNAIALSTSEEWIKKSIDLDARKVGEALSTDEAMTALLKKADQTALIWGALDNGKNQLEGGKEIDQAVLSLSVKENNLTLQIDLKLKKEGDAKKLVQELNDIVTNLRLMLAGDKDLEKLLKDLTIKNDGVAVQLLLRFPVSILDQLTN